MTNLNPSPETPPLKETLHLSYLKILRLGEYGGKVYTEEDKKNSLWKYIKLNFGVEIPRVAICKNHDAPFDFIYAAFMSLYSMIVALANRSGGKTFDFAILSVLDSIANNKCESSNMGAIESQAIRCYRYITQFVNNNSDFTKLRNGVSTMTRSKFINDSTIEVLVATIAGTNSPHGQKNKIDEVELINWFILQQALSISQTKEGVKAVTVMGSTRKFSHGPMQRLIDAHKAHLFQWCCWDVMELWPKDESFQKEIRRTFGDLLPSNVEQCDGFYKWTDLIDKFNVLDRETFETEWMCQKPESSGLIFPKFDDILNLDKSFVLDKTKQIQIWEDFGYAKDHPDAIAFAQVDLERMTFTVFDELYLYYKPTKEIIIAVIQKLKEHGLIDEGLTTDESELYNLKNFAEYFTQINGWVPDYHGLTEIEDRNSMGCPMLPKVTDDDVPESAKLYLIENGIPLVRKFVDERRCKITPNIKFYRSDMMSYSRKRLPDGTYSDKAEKKNDHAFDLSHYGVIRNWPTLTYAPLVEPEQTSADKPESKQPEDTMFPGIDNPPMGIGDFGTITGDLNSKVF